MKRNLSLSLILVLLVSGARAYTPTPCFVDTGCPQPEPAKVFNGGYGTRVETSFLYGNATSFQSYGGKLISYAGTRALLFEFGDAAGKAKIGMLYVPGTGRGRLLLNGTLVNYGDKANTAQTITATQMLMRDGRITPIRMVPTVLPAGGVGFWSDLQGAWDAGASSACNMATLESMVAASAYLSAALAGNFPAAAAAFVVWIKAMEAQAVACGQP